jgi:hypothetical protein
MAQISALGMKELHSRTRKILVKIPNITATDLCEMLDINIKTACNILNNIRRENIERIENEDIKDEIAKLQDRMSTIATELWTIITDKETPASKGVKIYALKTLSDISHRIHEAKMDGGIFRRHLGQVDVRPEFNLAELLQNADTTTRQQFIKLAKQIISDKRDAIEGSIIPNGLALPDRAGNIQSDEESAAAELAIGRVAQGME